METERLENKIENNSVYIKNKYKNFIKNMSIAVVGAVAGGVGGAELSDLLTDSKGIISISSTVGQYVGSLVFLPLHAHDNPDLYREEETNKFKYNVFIKDMVKMTFGFGILDVLYWTGRPVINYYFQRKGFDPTKASLLTDAICIPSYCILAVPMAKFLGIIREKKN